MKKRSVHIPKGMTKDLSASKFGAEYYYDALNVKLTASENNTMLSITNVKSNKVVQLKNDNGEEAGFNDIYLAATESSGQHIWNYLGHIVLNEYIVIFAQCSGYNGNKVEKESDCIFRINTSQDYATTLLAYGDFGFSPSNPIEGLGIYEKEDVQKVYWIDGINQPRLLNIVKDEVITDATKIDFVRTLSFGETITINRSDTAVSAISAGIMQYAFTYYNLYGQESNIFYTSSLHYISYNNRGADAEDTHVGSSFSIKIENPDSNFQYVRIYSIHRTSINATPICRRVIDLPVTEGETINFVDDGTIGDSIDPTLLLYVGGRQVFPYTMEQKDNTLFFGNYKEGNTKFDTAFRNGIKDADIQFESGKEVAINQNNAIGSFYSYEHQLKKSSKEITTYKYGETYRFGVQLQKATGEWSEPIFIKDLENSIAPRINDGAWDTAKLAQASLDITSLTYTKDEETHNWIAKAKEEGYVNIRPMVVFPSMTDRTIICQGILNPTVFNVADRATNSPFAQASWFFRPNYSSFDYATSSGEYSALSKNYVLVALKEPQNSTVLNSLTRGDEVTLASIIGTNRERTKEEATYSYYGKLKLTNYGNTNKRVDVLILSKISGTTIEKSDGTIIQWLLEVVGDSPTVTYEIWKRGGGIVGTVVFKSTQTLARNYKDYLEVWTEEVPSGLNVVGNDGYLTWDNNAVWTSNSYALEHYINYEENQTDYSGIFKSSTFTNIVVAEASNTISGVVSQFTHYEHLPFNKYRNAEIQCNYGDGLDGDNVSISVFGENNQSTSEDRNKFIDKYSDIFFVDQSIVTLNSPDIDFDTNLQCIDSSNLKLRIVGYIPITATISDIDITTSTGPLNFFNKSSLPRGFWHETVGQVGYNGYLGLLSAPMWYDEWFRTKGTEASLYNGYMIYPWHRSGSLNNQPSAVIEGELSGYAEKLGLASGVRSAMLERKILSHLRYSAITQYLVNIEGEETIENWDNENVSIGLFNSNDITNVKLDGQYYNTKDINYYGNIDRVLTTSRKYNKAEVSGYPIMGTEVYSDLDNKYSDYHSAFTTGAINAVGDRQSGDDDESDDWEFNIGYDPIRMKYKSNPHAVICMRGTNEDDRGIDILPKMSNSEITVPTYNVNPFWNQEVIRVHQDTIDTQTNYGYLWLGELYDATDKSLTRFGGNSDDAIESNTWLPAGESVSLDGDGEGHVVLKWTEGDTYYQRYDCLKTYPFTQEDPNSIVDICSFMVETRVNIDGRYDRNRGQLSNLYMSPQNFNLLNPVYSQKNNYFNYKILNQEMFNSTSYKNYITWSKTKTPGEKTDTWTNVTLANVLDLDGDKGDIQAIKRFGNTLFSFQDRGISQILYNENMQISTTDGVPIEIANSGKVQGKRYISETIGCQNKWSISSSPYGLYFIDANNKTLNRLSQSIEDLTNIFGFNSWAKNNIQKGIWNVLRETEGVYRTLYDHNNKDIFFVGNHNTDFDSDCLVYSEMANQFTSFFSWQNALDAFNVGDKLFAIDEEEYTYDEAQNEAHYRFEDEIIEGAEIFNPGGENQGNEEPPTDTTPTEENPSEGSGDGEGDGGEENPDTPTTPSDDTPTGDEGEGDNQNPDNPSEGETTEDPTENPTENPEEEIDKVYKDIRLYHQYAGEDYNHFFDRYYPFSITYIDAQEPFEDKTYSNIEFRAVVENESHLPFDYLEAWNEYQKGRAYLKDLKGYSAYLHHQVNKEANLDRKFRMWRCDIPRDNVGMFKNGEGNLVPHPMNRLRNPWIYLKLLKTPEDGGMKEIELHDLLIDYFM